MTKIERLLAAAGVYKWAVATLVEKARFVHELTGLDHVIVGMAGVRLGVRHSGGGSYWLHLPEAA